ncbi:hypothetical protein ACFL3G_11745 [Planctomycetota bacterium]
MIASNSNSLCSQAEPHYYDYICGDNREQIPELIIDHIGHCPNCGRQIENLKGVLQDVEDNVDSHEKHLRDVTTYMLQLHFAYIGKPVGCDTVKTFLPSLLEPDLEVKIPTPITAHLDNCQQCCDDLHTIEQLALDRKQLKRLTQLFVSKTDEDTVDCSDARDSIASIAAMDWSRVDAETLKHLCKCSACRSLLYQKRQEMLESLPGYDLSPDFPCEAVQESSIFDYCFPYDIDPAGDEYAMFRQGFTAHLRDCRMCLSKIQQLHETIETIIERSESETVTIFSLDESAQTETAAEYDNPYAGFPVRVKCLSREAVAAFDEQDEPTESSIDFTAGVKRKAPPRTFVTRLFKSGSVAAAVILAAALFFFAAPKATAITVESVNKAMSKVRNYYVGRFDPEKQKFISERWISKSLDIRLYKTEREMVLLDYDKSTRKSKKFDTGVVDTETMSYDQIAARKKRPKGILGIIPYDSRSGLHIDYEWDCVTGQCPQAAIDGFEVYDVKWTQKSYNDSTIFRKKRLFIDPKTNLPHRVEIYRKSAIERRYELATVITVKYLKSRDIRRALEENPF